MGIVACLIHELGHILMMKILGVKISTIEFYLLGIKISKSKAQIIPYNREFIILIVGIVLNLIISAFMLLIGNSYLQTFGMVNAAIAIFNLLPFKMFDGGQIKELLIERYCSSSETLFKIKTSVKFITIIIISAVCVFLLIKENITAAFALLFFLLFEIFDER
jgi:stage IV sporulation protein FB